MKLDSHSRVLAVLPTLGQRPELLQLTLESLVNQKPDKPDIVLISPLTNMETKKLAKQYGANVIDDPGGLSAAVNAGIASAKSYHKYITWIGDDDLLTKDSLKTSINALNASPSAVLAFGYCDYIDENGQFLFKSKAGNLAPWLMTWGPNLVPLPGILFRLDAIKSAGGFDNNLKYSMDLDLLIRLRKIGKFINTGQTLAAFRWHSSSTTVANRNKSLEEAAMVKRRYMSQPIRLLAPIWEWMVVLATKVAVYRVNRIAKKLNKR